jgi:hypothetical protein
MNWVTSLFGKQITRCPDIFSSMNFTTPLEITITLIQPELDNFDLERLTQQLYQRLMNIPELIAIERIEADTISEGYKGGHYLIDCLKAKARFEEIEAIANSVYDYSQAGCATMKVNTPTGSVEISTAELTKSEFVDRVNSSINTTKFED